MQPTPGSVQSEKTQKGNGLLAEESHFSGAFHRRLFMTFWWAYRPHLGSLLACLLIGLLGRGAFLINMTLLGRWADSLCQGASCPQLPMLLVGWGSWDFLRAMIALTVGGLSLTLLFWTNFARLGVKAAGAIHDEAAMRISRFPMRFFDTNPIGRIFARFSADYGNVQRCAGGPLADFVGHAMDFFWMFLLVGFASPYFLILVALALLSCYWVFHQDRPLLRAERRALSAVRGPSYAHFAETVQGHRVIKVFLRQPAFMDKFRMLLDQLNLQKLRSSVAITWYSFKMQTIGATLLLGTALLGLFLVRQGSITLGAVASAITLLTMATHSTQRFFDLIVMIEEALTGAERLDEYVHGAIEMGASLPTQRLFPTNHPVVSAAPSAIFHAASIELRHVSMRYDLEMPWVLKDVSLKADQGERIGIIGRTGSGKSSLFQAIFHLYDTVQGEFLINGKIVKGGEMLAKAPLDLAQQASGIPALEEISIEHFRRQLSLISQDPAIFQGTLRENLDPDCIPDSSRDGELLDALSKVGLGIWVHELGANPLNHLLMERGTNLSAGQRQLLCMARCILAQTPILLMDEATSALDPRTEAWTMRSLDNWLRGRTQLIIAHRLSTVERCDRVYWLDQGKIWLQGTPRQVLQEFRRFLTQVDGCEADFVEDRRDGFRDEKAKSLVFDLAGH